MIWSTRCLAACGCVTLLVYSARATGANGAAEPRLTFASPEMILGDGMEPLYPTIFELPRSGDEALVEGDDGEAARRMEASCSPDVSPTRTGEVGAGIARPDDAPGSSAVELAWEPPKRESYCWGCAIGQSLLFATIGHVFRLASEEKTRRELDGPFFRDWFKSAGALYGSGWSDGGKFFTNYVIHPLSGAVYGHIYRQNSPQDRAIDISLSKAYLGHMGKTTAFSFLASLAWEIGPYSEASIGNVGLHNTPESQQMTWGDIVVTPVMGIWGVMLVEDLFERFVIRKVDARTGNRWLKALSRIPLTPTRSAANLMAFKRPDYRPDRQ